MYFQHRKDQVKKNIEGEGRISALYFIRKKLVQDFA